MAGDWIKMRGNLWDDPRVARLCDLCDCGEAQVIGALYWLWSAADQHTEDGVMPGLTLRQIDRKTGVPGFGEALCSIGWLADHPEGARIVKFEEHNGTSAKRRCVDAQRKASVRSMSASDADKSRTDDGQKTPNLGAREREREEISEAKASSSSETTESTPPAKPDGIPACRHDALIDLYHELLPELPRVKLRTPDRQRALGKLWRWVLTNKKADGTRRATTADEAVEWFRLYFGQVRDNDFLMGRTQRSDQHKGWACTFDFLLTDRGMKQVIERTYAEAEAA